MNITYGDHLIDSGYYDITPEQEREIERRDEQRCQKCGELTKREEAYVDGQIWCHPCADHVGTVTGVIK